MKIVDLLVGSAVVMTSVFGVAGYAVHNIPAGGKAPYPVTNVVEFNGTIGGHQITYTGTVQSIFDYAEAMHPDINRPQLIQDAKIELGIEHFSNNAAIAARTPDGPDCKWDDNSWGIADYSAIMDGIYHFIVMLGPCNVNPLSCMVIWCETASTMMICNTNDYNVGPDYLTVTNEFLDVATACVKEVDNGFWTKGIEADSDGWNVQIDMSRLC